jgi:micrococcal nuclease
MPFNTIFLTAAIVTLLLSSCTRRSVCTECTACPTCPPCEDKVSETQPNRWLVYRVIDGDTIVVLQQVPERKETVRLLNIDTPERNAPGFEEAREAIKSLLRTGFVMLAYDKPGVEKRDGFGRLLAFVMINNENANIEMVRRGWSKFFTKYGKGRFREQFEQAEKEARENHRGLWGM